MVFLNDNDKSKFPVIEQVSNIKRDSSSAFLYATAIMFILIITAYTVRYLAILADNLYINWLSLLIYMILGYFIYREKLRKYEYKLTKKSFNVFVISGKRTKQVIKIPVKSIIYAGATNYKKFALKKKHRLCFMNNKKMIIYKSEKYENLYEAVIVSVSQSMLNTISLLNK